ncbi:hypothetical protein FK873_gp194 [Micromonas pusilla virus SP1]|jgi:hypothetical protein|uniref:Uncharacterized protein n=1 Tax=Micromonas pusilla virus SP1 TaxID=373996 RepID=G9E6B7_MPSP1|nr:hypothetical protein FK873_gp194 [Micromonas pusilla virus SP1]AET84944.1 hypothetical protein MPXG_00146 [Micromonas pusilla virus SP1]
MKVAPSDYLKWYRPIDPTLRSFLHDYYKKKKNLNKTPCFCKGPTMRHLGGCTLLKRNKYSKMRETTLTNVIFANFTKYEIEITVKSIATNVSGCGIGIFGNTVTMDVTQSDKLPQTMVIRPALHRYNLIKKVTNDIRVLNFKTNYQHPKNLLNLMIPERLSTSTLQIDPGTHSYYLTVRLRSNVNDEWKILMTDILHHSCYDVIFENVHLNENEMDNVMKERIKELKNEMTRKGRELDRLSEIITDGS